VVIVQYTYTPPPTPAPSIDYLDAIRKEYEAKMQALEAAKAAELQALEENNASALQAASADRQRTLAELGALRATYDATAEKLQQMQGKYGSVADQIEAQNAEIEALQRQLLTTVAPTAAPTTAAPTPAPGPQWSPGIFVFIDRRRWLENGELVVAAMNGGDVTMEPFAFRSLNQVWAISGDGHVRSLADEGLYINAMDSCLLPVGSSSVPIRNWQFRKTGTHGQHAILSLACNAWLIPGVSTAELSKQQEDWYVVRVGTMRP
jgi:hypothetical protein